MKSKENLNELEELISRFLTEVTDRGYCKSVYYNFKANSVKLLKWCDVNSIIKYDEDVGARFILYVKDMYATERNHKWNNQIVRFIRLLNSFQKGDDFEYRTPNTLPSFREESLIYVNNYLNYCGDVMQSSLAAIRDRRHVLWCFDEYLATHNKEITKIDCDTIEHFIAERSTQNARTRYKGVLKQFYHFLFTNKITNEDISLQILKEPRIAHVNKLPTTYTEDEIKRIIKSVDRNAPIGKRDYLILLLAAEYGIRASDIAALRIDQINWDKNTISIVQKKTKAPVSFPLLASVGNAIVDYLKHGRPESSYPNLILRHDQIYKGKPVTSSTIFDAVTRAMKNSDIPDWKSRRHGPHALRHSLATNLLKQDISIPIISSILGHKCVESTRIYVGVDIEMLRQCSLDIPEIKSPHFYYNKRRTL